MPYFWTFAGLAAFTIIGNELHAFTGFWAGYVGVFFGCCAFGALALDK